jgi:peptidoglycan hydrolase-like protein with peptidoglycan-binding domain
VQIRPGTAGTSRGRGRRAAAIGFAALICLALIGWIAAGQIRSPAQVAADTAPPVAAPITVPVVKRTLSTEVIVRGTVRYGAPQSVVLGSSRIKQGSSIVTRPPRRGATLKAGSVAMMVDSRPVFVLPGAVPMHRDLRPGDFGPDVRQLERDLAGMGFNPGRVDGRYDAATQSAVTSFYLRRGFDPFGTTDTQHDQVQTAEAAAAAARDAHLQALATLTQARTTPARADVEQARLDAVSARDALDTSVLGVSSAKAKLAAARTAAAGTTSGQGLANANNARDITAADADVAAKRAALNQAIDDQHLAAVRRDELPGDAPASDRAAADAAVRQAGDKVTQAQADLTASQTAADAVRANAAPALQKARDDAAQAQRDVRSAAAELHRAQLAVDTGRQALRYATLKVRAMTRPADVATLEAIAVAAAQEERRTASEVRRLSSQDGVQVPADEILFFPSLPLRIDLAKARRGSQVTGTVMNVTNSRLAIDSSLSISDHQLVHPGDRVAIDDQDLGIKTAGVVSQRADTPGTNRVDPSRFYISVLPTKGFPSLVGASVKLTISVKSTKGSVLAVPPSALSVGGDGNSRLQIRRNGLTRLVTVVPGLAAEGLVEVRPAGKTEQLSPGDLVVVGSAGGGALGAGGAGPGA